MPPLDDDVAAIGEMMSTDSIAVAFVFENRWLLGIVGAWRASGARLLADGGVAADDVVAALDTTER